MQNRIIGLAKYLVVEKALKFAIIIKKHLRKVLLVTLRNDVECIV